MDVKGMVKTFNKHIQSMSDEQLISELSEHGMDIVKTKDKKIKWEVKE